MTLPNHPHQTDEHEQPPSNRGKWIPIIVVAVVAAMALTHFINSAIG